MPINPILPGQATYPFVRLNQAAAARRAKGLEVIDFGMGDPREPTDPRIIEALRDGVRERMGYPAAVGLPELREAVAGWVAGRFGASLDPDAHVIPTLGSKEAIFSFAHVVLDLAGGTRHRRPDGAGLPGRGARGAVRRCPGRRAAAARGERLPPRPRRRGGRDMAADGARLGQLPEQPHRSHGAARVLRAARGAGARARLRARLRRGVHASSGSTSRPSRRSSSATGRTWRCSTRCPSARR